MKWETFVVKMETKEIVERGLSWKVGRPAARKIAMRLAEDWGNGTYLFVKTQGTYYRLRKVDNRLRCWALCRVEVGDERVRTLDPLRPFTRPCEEFIK